MTGTVVLAAPTVALFVASQKYVTSPAAGSGVKG